MITSTQRKYFGFVMLLLAASGVAGCGKGISGKYADKQGILSIEFKSGKAYYSPMGNTLECDYKVDDDKVILDTHGQGNVVLTLNADGTLIGPMGIKMTKQ